MAKHGPSSGCATIYTINVHGDGKVEYVGEEYVRDRGPHTDALSKRQLQTLLQKFDDAGFFLLEDRAFAWGYHTPRVRVSISLDGRKRKSRATLIGWEPNPDLKTFSCKPQQNTRQSNQF